MKEADYKKSELVIHIRTSCRSSAIGGHVGGARRGDGGAVAGDDPNDCEPRNLAFYEALRAAFER